MAITYLTLKDVSTTTAEDGTVTIAGVSSKKAILPAITDVVMTPFQINDDQGYKSNSAAAVGAISWGVFGALTMDYLHAIKSGESILPFIDMLPGVSAE